MNESDLGGWGLGCAFPDCPEVVNVVSQCISKGLPREFTKEPSEGPCEGRSQSLSDAFLPDSWSNGEVQWFELLSGRHAFAEHINVLESRVLNRSLDVASRIPSLRRSRVLFLEDNSVTHFNVLKGRSPQWVLNLTCRQRAALQLVSDIEVVSAWIRSANMPMDSLSRRCGPDGATPSELVGARARV